MFRSVLSLPCTGRLNKLSAFFNTRLRYNARARIVTFMKKILLTFVLFCCATPVFAQPNPSPKQWAGVGAATRFDGSGVTLSYGQQDLFAPGTDARFSVSYVGPAYYETGFSAEVSADALAYTYDPDPAQGLALVAYGGLGPRLLVRSNVYNYTYSVDATFASYQLDVGGVGGLEARLGNFGLLLELDVSLPALGLIGPYF